MQGFDAHLHFSIIQSPGFSVGELYAEQCAFNSGMPKPWNVAQEWLECRFGMHTLDLEEMVELGGVQVDRAKYPALQRNAAQVKGNHRILPKPIVVKVNVNGRPARALLDSGSLGDFLSSTLADQLSIKREQLTTPLS